MHLSLRPPTTTTTQPTPPTPPTTQKVLCTFAFAPRPPPPPNPPHPPHLPPRRYYAPLPSPPDHHHHHTTQPPTHPPIRYECVFYHRCICSIIVKNYTGTLHGGQSRSWSAEQTKQNKRKKSGSAPPSPPPPTLLVRRQYKIKITRRIIYRRCAGLGPSRVRTRIPSTRRLGQGCCFAKSYASVCDDKSFPVSLLLSSPGGV